MPANASAASAACPPAPAMCTFKPSLSGAISRSSSATSGMAFQPSVPKLKLTSV